jgi:hypothetical protein
MEYSPTTFQLPPGNWVMRVDTQEAFDGDTYVAQQGATTTSYNARLGSTATVPGSAYVVPPYTMVVLESAE